MITKWNHIFKHNKPKDLPQVEDIFKGLFKELFLQALEMLKWRGSRVPPTTKVFQSVVAITKKAWFIVTFSQAYLGVATLSNDVWGDQEVMDRPYEEMLWQVLRSQNVGRIVSQY